MIRLERQYDVCLIFETLVWPTISIYQREGNRTCAPTKMEERIEGGNS